MPLPSSVSEYLELAMCECQGGEWFRGNRIIFLGTQGCIQEFFLRGGNFLKDPNIIYQGCVLARRGHLCVCVCVCVCAPGALGGLGACFPRKILEITSVAFAGKIHACT